MKAAMYLPDGRFSILEKPDPKPGEGEILIRIRSTSICGSDLSRTMGGLRPEIFRAIQGHEFGGEVLEARAGFEAGDEVCVYPVITCGMCDACQRGLEHLCVNLQFLGVQLNGGFCEKAAVPANNLYRLPPEIDMKYASLVEPLAVCIHAVRKLPVSAGETIAVFGCGMIGFLCAILLREWSAARIIVLDVNPHRLEIARHFGFETLNPAKEDIVGEMSQKTGGRLADVVFDCAGKPDVPNLLAAVCRVDGRIILVGTYETTPQFDIQKIIRRELVIHGSRIYTRQDFLEAISLLKNWAVFSQLPLLSLPLNEINQGFNILRGEPDILRIILIPDGSERDADVE